MGFDKAETIITYTYFLQQLNQLNIAFVTYVRYVPDFDAAKRGTPIDPNEFKPFFTNGKWILNGAFDGMSAKQAVDNDEADAIAFGRPFISNPDLPYRIRNDLTWTQPNPLDFYWDTTSPIEKGYTDHAFAPENPESYSL